MLRAGAEGGLAFSLVGALLAGARVWALRASARDAPTGGLLAISIRVHLCPFVVQLHCYGLELSAVGGIHETHETHEKKYIDRSHMREPLHRVTVWR